jgi:hypothetical protein
VQTYTGACATGTDTGNPNTRYLLIVDRTVRKHKRIANATLRILISESPLPPCAYSYLNRQCHLINTHTAVPAAWEKHAGDYCSSSTAGGKIVFDVKGLTLAACQARGVHESCLCVAYLKKVMECKGTNLATPKHSSSGWDAYTR